MDLMKMSTTSTCATRYSWPNAKHAKQALGQAEIILVSYHKGKPAGYLLGLTHNYTTQLDNRPRAVCRPDQLYIDQICSKVTGLTYHNTLFLVDTFKRYARCIMGKNSLVTYAPENRRSILSELGFARCKNECGRCEKDFVKYEKLPSLGYRWTSCLRNYHCITSKH